MSAIRNRRVPALTRALSSSLAIAAALIAGPVPVAHAQSFQASSSVIAGNATVITGSGTTTVTINSPSAVINWTPTDTAIGGGPVNFQPAGTTATFQQNLTGPADFSVLNRILPTDQTRAVQFNGNVISQIQAVSGPAVPGGVVYFYSPGGIIVGPSAVFDVGSLGLTTAAPVYDASGNFDTGNVVDFTTANPGTAVQIQSGAQINASGNSYVAVVAPQVTNDGTITVGRVAALVSADAATITFSLDGLFDIQVNEGTSASGFTLRNTGSITGPAGNPVTGALNRIYMVAVPKNNLISMLISGSTLGFDVAAAADTVGNAVILSAGYDIVNGTASANPSAGAGTGLADIQLHETGVTSYFESASTRNTSLASLSSPTSFASDVVITSQASGQIFASGATASVTIAGDLSVRSPGNSGPLADGTSVTGGRAVLDANGGGTVLVQGDAFISADGTGAGSSTPGIATGSGSGGNASISASDGGTLTINGITGLYADGLAGFARSPGVDGGNGRGGSAGIFLSGTSAASITLTGGITASASGYGANGQGCVSCADDGGNGQGGQVFLSSKRQQRP